MKGCILLGGKRYYTNMKEIFDGINNVQMKYNWLITDYECNCYPDSRIPFDNDCEYIWITGEELTEIVQKNDIQFIWGVFSAFSKEKNLDEILDFKLQSVHEYSIFENGIKAQHPLAEIEITSFDSTYAQIISKHPEIINDFRTNFEKSKDLEEYINKYYKHKKQ